MFSASDAMSISASNDSLRKSSKLEKGVTLPDKLIIEQGHVTRTDREVLHELLDPEPWLSIL